MVGRGDGSSPLDSIVRVRSSGGGDRSAGGRGHDAASSVELGHRRSDVAVAEVVNGEVEEGYLGHVLGLVRLQDLTSIGEGRTVR